MDQGYITIANKNWEGLLNVLVDSVLKFSDKPIRVFSINFDYSHENERVSAERIDIEEENFQTLCLAKTKASLKSPFKETIYLDADIVITPELDSMFGKEIDKFPLYPLHPKDPDNQQNVMNFLGVEGKSQPYVHAASFIFNKSCIPFLEELRDCHIECLNHAVIPDTADETVINTLLWKYRQNIFTDTYTPYYQFFIDRDINEIPDYNWIQKVTFCCSHGEKREHEARQILNKIAKDYDRL